MSGWSTLQEQISLEGNRALIGQTVELAGRQRAKDARTTARQRMTGRARDGRLVHFAADDGCGPATSSPR